MIKLINNFLSYFNYTLVKTSNDIVTASDQDEIQEIKNHRAYNKADIARELNCSRVWISRVMRGKVKHPKTLQRIKHYLHNLNQAA